MNDFKGQVDAQIKLLLNQKSYPCVAAIQSLHRKDYCIKTYANFGKVHHRSDLRNELLQFLKKYQETNSQYFSLWAVFEDDEMMTEDEFEKLLWSELSSLTSDETAVADQDPRFDKDPVSKDFCFSLGGKAVFVVGLHPKSSRMARQFPWPALIFNAYEQFDQLIAHKKYEPMIETIRRREIEFQGDVNPMVLQHNDIWESIQFSGKKNDENWKCPFQFRKPETSV